MVQPHSAKWESKALILISEKSPPHSTFSLQGCPGVRTRVHLPLRSRSCPRPVKPKDLFWCGPWSYAGFKARLSCRMKSISRCGPRQWAVLEQAGSIGEITPSSFVVVQSLRGFQLFVTWTAALQPPCPSPSPRVCSNSCPLSWWCHSTISPSCHPLLLLPSIFPSIRDFSSESVLCISWPKYWNFSFSISPFNDYSGLISFRKDWWDLLAVQGTLKSLLHHHSSKASVLQCSAFFIVQLSHPYMTTGKNVALTRLTFVGKGPFVYTHLIPEEIPSFCMGIL